MDLSLLTSSAGSAGLPGSALPTKLTSLLDNATNKSTPGGAFISTLSSGGSAKNAAKSAASAVGAGLCAATGVGAGAAPVCGAIAGILTGGISILFGGISKRKKEARKVVSDLKSEQKLLDASFAEAVKTLQTAWLKMAPGEPAISAIQAGDMLREAGLVLVWDTTSDSCSPATASAWRVPFFLSLVYQKPSYNRSKVKCKYGDTTPSKWMTSVTAKRARAEMSAFKKSLVTALENAGSVLVTLAASRAAVRASSDADFQAAVVKREQEIRSARIRNYAIGGAVLLSAGGVAYFIARRAKA